MAKRSIEQRKIYRRKGKKIKRKSGMRVFGGGGGGGKGGGDQNQTRASSSSSSSSSLKVFDGSLLRSTKTEIR